jgi:hypothetical protein
MNASLSSLFLDRLLDTQYQNRQGAAVYLDSGMRRQIDRRYNDISEELQTW